MIRVLKWVGIAVGSIIAVIVIALAVALSSPSVGRKLIALGMKHAPPALTIGQVSGRLRSPLYLTHVGWHTPSMQVSVDSIEIRWRLSHLVLRTLQLDRLHISGVRVTMADSAPPDTSARTARTKPHLPLDVRLGDVLIRNVSVAARDSISAQFDSVRMVGRAAAYRLMVSGSATVPKVKQAALHLAGNGTLESMEIDTARADLVGGNVVMRGHVQWWPVIGWKVNARASRIQPALLLADPASLPGAISALIASSGTIDSLGPTAKVALDSLSGTLRKQPLRGMARVAVQHASYRVDSIDAGWGTAALTGAGTVGDALAAHFHLVAADLHSVLPTAAGSLDVTGEASGSKAAPHMRLNGHGAHLRSGANAIAQLSIKADVDVVKNGTVAVDLRADSATLAGQPVSTLTLGAHGTRDKHHIALAGRSPKGIATLALDGGYDGARWAGIVTALQLDSSAAGRWQLQHSARLVASKSLIRLDSLCVLQRDSTNGGAGSLCISGSKAAGRINGSADANAIPIVWLASKFAARADSVTGTIGAHFTAAMVGNRITASAHVATDSASLLYHKPNEKKPSRLALDSGVVDISIGNDGAHGTVAASIGDGSRSLASVAATVAIPCARTTGALATSAMTAHVDIDAASLTFLQPFVTDADSLRGGFALHVDGSGTVHSPAITGTADLKQLVLGLPGPRAITGSIAAKVDAKRAANGALDGTISITPSDFRYVWRDLGRNHFLAIGGTGLTASTASQGANGSVNLHVSSDAGAEVATIGGKLAMPEYGGSAAMATQAVTANLTASIASLQAMQPLLQQVDSLAGTMQLAVDVTGHLGAPTVAAKMTVDSLRAHLPFGSTMRGSIAADLKAAVAEDSALTATFSVTPTDMAFSYEQNGAHKVTLDSSAITLSAGGDGVKGQMSVTFAENGATLGTLAGTVALPQYTRYGRPLHDQVLNATLTGRADNLSFVQAFTPLVDSASGHFALDSKVTGTVGDSRLTGSLDITGGVFHLPSLGVTYDSVQVAARGDDAGTMTVQAGMRSGGGTLTITGSSPSKPAEGTPGTVHIEGTNFTAANSAQLRAVVSPKLDVTITNQMQIKGEVQVPIARLQLAQLPPTAVAPSDDVVLIDTTGARAASLPLSTDINVVLGDSVTFSGFNFDAKLSGGLRVMQDPDHLATGSGSIVIDSGSYKAYGQDLTIKNGSVQFAGGPINDPALNIRAARTAEDSVVAGLDIKGTLKQPDVEIFSEPSMSQTEALSYILTGHAAGQGTGGSGNLLSKALSAIGLKGGNALAGTLGKQLGLADAKIEATGDIKKASFVAGTYLSPNVYVSYGIGLFDPVSTLKLRYVVSNHVTLQTETGTATGGDLLVKTTSKP